MDFGRAHDPCFKVSFGEFNKVKKLNYTETVHWSCFYTFFTPSSLGSFQFASMDEHRYTFVLSGACWAPEVGSCRRSGHKVFYWTTGLRFSSLTFISVHQFACVLHNKLTTENVARFALGPFPAIQEPQVASYSLTSDTEARGYRYETLPSAVERVRHWPLRRWTCSVTHSFSKPNGYDICSQKYAY
jgi:hypothetical protein